MLKAVLYKRWENSQLVTLKKHVQFMQVTRTPRHTRNGCTEATHIVSRKENVKITCLYTNRNQHKCHKSFVVVAIILWSHLDMCEELYNEITGITPNLQKEKRDCIDKKIKGQLIKDKM